MPGVAGDEPVLRSLRWANTRPGLSVFIVPRFSISARAWIRLLLTVCGVTPSLNSSDRVSHREFGLVAKRVFDAAVAGAALLVLSPLLLVIAAAVKLSDRKGPVFFKQERVGLYGEPINVLEIPFDARRGKDTEWMGRLTLASPESARCFGAPHSTRSPS